MNLVSFDKMAQDLNNQNPNSNVNMRHQMQIPSATPPAQQMYANIQ